MEELDRGEWYSEQRLLLLIMAVWCIFWSPLPAEGIRLLLFTFWQEVDELVYTSTNGRNGRM
jgi:hypothetical protein